MIPKQSHKILTVTLTRPMAPSVAAALHALQDEYPAAFRQPPRPLPEGILQTVHETLAGEHSKKAVRRALAHWCNRTDYLRAVAAEDAHLIGLDGSDAGPVPAEQRAAARKRLAGKNLESPGGSRPHHKPASRPRPRRDEYATAAPTPAPPREERPAPSGPTIIKKRTRVRQSVPELPETHQHPSTPGKRPTLSLRKRDTDKSD